MQLELVNPFVEASHDVIKEFLNVDVEKSEISLMDKNSLIHGVAVRILFHLKPDSAVVVNMEESVAKAVVEKLIGEDFKGWDGLTCSALGELGNMVSGRAVTRLEGEKIDLDIDPPEVIFTDKEGSFPVLDEAMNVLLETSLGKLQVIVYLND